MKFEAANTSTFYQGLKAEVDRYFSGRNTTIFADFRLWVKAFLLLSAFGLSYALLYLYPLSFVQALLPFAIMGITGVMLVFNVVHDASHHAVFKMKKWNDKLRYLGDFLGINTYIWDIRHNVQHHTFTNVLGGDLIIENIPLLRLSPFQTYRSFHRFQHWYAPILYLFYSLYWIFLIDFKLFAQKEICNLKNIQHPFKEWLILFFFKALYVTYSILLPWWFTDFTLGQILLLFLFMHAVGGILLSVVAVLGHFVEGPSFPEPVDEKIPGNWAEHELAATIDFAPQSATVNWITGGLNTHVAHHLFPRMSHVHYRSVTKIIQQYCQTNGYAYHSESFPAALQSHFRYLKRLSNPPSAAY